MMRLRLSGHSRGLGAFPRIGALLILVAASPAQAALPDGHDCASVQALFAQWRWAGMTAIRGYLRTVKHYSPAQIAEAERCVGQHRPGKTLQ